MKRVFTAMLFAAFAATGWGLVHAAQPAYGGGLTGITGDYAVQLTGPTLIAGTMHLTQVGNTVIGSAEAGRGNGVLQFHGTVSGTKVSGQWRGPTGETGWLTLNFNPSGTSFNGTWGYGGRKPSGSIVARKIRNTSF